MRLSSGRSRQSSLLLRKQYKSLRINPSRRTGRRNAFRWVWYPQCTKNAAAMALGEWPLESRSHTAREQIACNEEVSTVRKGSPVLYWVAVLAPSLIIILALKVSDEILEKFALSNPANSFAAEGSASSQHSEIPANAASKGSAKQEWTPLSTLRGAEKGNRRLPPNVSFRQDVSPSIGKQIGRAHV